MIIYIYGEDSFRSRQYLKKTIEQFKRQRDPQGYNVIILEGKKADASRVLSEVVSVPFLAERRMIVLENILSSTDKGLLSELAERVKSGVPESNVVVIWQGDVFGKNKEVKALAELLSKEKYAQEFKPMERAELVSWTNKEFISRGAKIERQALEFLVNNAGKDLWFLNSLIDQLSAYVADTSREVVLADIQLFLEEKEDDNIFNMVDAVVSGNKKLAFKLINDQRRLGQEDMYLFSMILRQFKILLQLRDVFERDESTTSEVLAKEVGIHPYVVKKSLVLVKRYSLEKLKDLYNNLLQIDIKTKTGQGDQSLMLDLFVGMV